MLRTMKDSLPMLTSPVRRVLSEPELGLKVYICSCVENVFEIWRRAPK